MTPAPTLTAEEAEGIRRDHLAWEVLRGYAAAAELERLGLEPPRPVVRVGREVVVRDEGVSW